MASENLGTQFQNLSTINKIGISLAGFNAVGLILVISILSSLAGVKAELQGAIDNSTERFYATLTDAESRITSAVDQAVSEMSSSGISLSCSGTYDGSLNLSIPEAPDSFTLSGSVFGSSIYGSVRSQSIIGPVGRNTESGSMSLSCR